ncbi:hypothetical protein [Nonomuraea sp. NPDC050202]|uniref:hypothetical protein n=1 Tax=Nonomuraea sp. NPDC050202 TaxID=3155035 RepID=UPI0034118A34
MIKLSFVIALMGSVEDEVASTDLPGPRSDGVRGLDDLAVDLADADLGEPYCGRDREDDAMRVGIVI